VAHDLEAFLAHEEQHDKAAIIRMLGGLTRGVLMAFDKNHRQIRQAYIRFSYFFHAAHLLEDLDPVDITAEVLQHLEDAQAAMRNAWGQSEFARLAQNASRLTDFGSASEILSAERADASLASLTTEERAELLDALGIQKLNEIYRYVLSRAISDLWVEYLTQIESLRVSIGLEAYGQRDPLVQYKSKASEMFVQLLSDIRAAVISRIYAYQPRQLNLTPAESTLESTAGQSQSHSENVPQESAVTKKKRKRH
jgi:preprotein translocase subunit SecA